MPVRRGSPDEGGSPRKRAAGDLYEEAPRRDEDLYEEAPEEDEDLYREEGRRKGEPGSSHRSPTLSARSAGEAGLRHIAELTAKETEGITQVRPAEGGWKVEVEVVEDRRVPSSGDVLALYEADMDPYGTLLSYRRVRRYRRGRGDDYGAS